MPGHDCIRGTSRRGQRVGRQVAAHRRKVQTWRYEAPVVAVAIHACAAGGISGLEISSGIQGGDYYCRAGDHYCFVSCRRQTPRSAWSYIVCLLLLLLKQWQWLSKWLIMSFDHDDLYKGSGDCCALSSDFRIVSCRSSRMHAAKVASLTCLALLLLY